MAFDFSIPAQRFETIRDQVAAIISAEFEAQLVLRPTETEFGADVWIERGIPYDREELPAVKVYFASANYSDENRITSKGTCQINVEVTAKGVSNDTDYGDKLAAKTCQKLLGAIRYILKHPTYNRLALSGRPYIGGINVTDIRIAEPTEQADAFRIIAGQLVLLVRYEEQNGGLNSDTQEGTYTSIKLDETDKGIKISKII